MSAIKSGVRPAVAGGVLAVLFAASVGVSAAAAIAMSPEETLATASTATTTPTPTPTPTPTRSAKSSSTSSSSERQVARVTSAPTKATKSQVKQSTSALCKADPQDLPKIDFQSGSRQWIKTLEVLAADRGFTPGAIDGIYNVQTRNAIRSFEDALGVAVDGVMDLAGWQALWDDLCAPDPVFVPTQPVYTPPTYAPPSNGGGGGGNGGGGSGDDGDLERLD